MAYTGNSNQKCIAEFSNRNGGISNTADNLHITCSHCKEELVLAAQGSA